MFDILYVYSFMYKENYMDVNLSAVVVAGLVGFVIGFFWYIPQLFGRQWMKAVGMSEKDMSKEGMGSKIGIALVATLLVSYVLSHVITGAILWKGNAVGSVDPVMTGVLAGFWVWLGFLATSLVDPVLWEHKPWKLWMINAGQWLVRLVAMGAILGAWR